MRRIWPGVICAALAVCLTVPAVAAKRVALVIGNDAYVNVPKLKKAVNDASSVGDALASIGFEVITGPDLTRREMNRKLADLEKRIEPGDIVFFFFAGHGVSIASETILLPVDMPAVESGQDSLMREEGFTADSIMRRLQKRGAATVFLVLDACRNNPFEAGGTRDIGLSRGLAKIEPPKGAFVLYSAGTGQTALDRLTDGDADPNSVFTRKLVPALKTPGLSQVAIAKRLQNEVGDLAATVQHEQVPAYYDEIRGEVVINVGVRVAPVAAAPAEEAPATKAPQAKATLLAPAVPAGPPAAADGEVTSASDMMALGDKHHFGRDGLTKDEAKAREWYEKAAAAGDSRGMFSLGVYYANGLGGLTKDEVTARQWYEKAAAAGNGQGMQKLAAVLDGGFGGGRDYVRAARLLLDACKADVQTALAHLHGTMTTWRPETRTELKRELARLGYYKGQVNAPWDAQATAAVDAYLSAPAAPVATADYLIQVQSNRSRAESLAYFADLQARYGRIIGGTKPFVQQVDLGAKGVWFRLRIGPLSSSDAAKEMCLKLVAAGVKDCFVAID